jgi:hypothetical protein
VYVPFPVRQESDDVEWRTTLPFVIRNRQKTPPFLEGKARELQDRTGLALFLHGLKVGFAHLQTLTNPAKSRVLLFDEYLSPTFPGREGRGSFQPEESF